MNLVELTYNIRGVIFEVHKELGSGLFEHVYENALLKEFELQKIDARAQVEQRVYYKGID